MIANKTGSRKLPSRPSLEHLKSQAKDLLAALRDSRSSGRVEACARIRAAVPAYANQSDDAIRSGPFALHDAQSAIAREYGFPSWAALRRHVSALGEPSEQSPSEEQSATAAIYEAAVLRMASGRPLPPEFEAEVRAALQRRGAAAAQATPPSVPVLPLRNAVAFPGAVFPIDVARPSTLRAIDAALAATPALLAVFSQRASELEQPAIGDFHATGCLCQVLFVHRPGQGAWVLLEGVRWVHLDALEHVEPYYLARVTDAPVAPGDASAVDALDEKLRERARRLAATLPEISDQALALIDAIKDPAMLADLVMANLQDSVEDKAAYARESDLVRKLEHVIARLDADLAQASPAEADG
jgi:Lon protease-like protein